MRKYKTSCLFFILFFILIITLLLATFYGSSNVKLNMDNLSLLSTEWKILCLRFNRACNAFVIGGSLALSGLLLQGTFNNRLVDPYTLGISSSASIGALLGVIFKQGDLIIYFLPIILPFCNITLLLYYVRNKTKEIFLLLGIGLSTLYNAILLCCLYLLDKSELSNLVFWLIGDLSTLDFPIINLLILIMGVAFAIQKAKALNILAMGEIKAYSLGVNVKKTQFIAYLIATILTITSINKSGPIGFIGLIIPNILYTVKINTYQQLIPFSVLSGGIFLILTDLIARIIIAPIEIPTGAITALIGAPVFIYLLLSKTNNHT